MNVLEEALLISTNNKSNQIEKDRKNSKHRSYNSKDLARLAQTLFRICVFCRIKIHIIIECLHIDNEVRDGFVRHVGQQMLDRDYVEQP
jgi:hypothetical protein